MTASRKSNIILGIDPGTDITGYGLVGSSHGSPALLEAGIIRCGNGKLEEKMLSLSKELMVIISEFKPSRMAVEELYAHYKHPRTSITMAHARGVILLAAAQAGIAVYSYPSTEIKKTITGKGSASKERVRAMITHILAMDAEPRYLDISDALAAAITDFRHSE